MLSNIDLKIGDLIIEKPIVQGGMGVGISLASLAGNVAREGGLGLISSAQIGFREPDFEKKPKFANLRAIASELKKAREIAGTMAKGAVGFNIMVATVGYADYVKEAIKHGADVIVSGAGLPLDLPELVKAGMKLRKELFEEAPQKIYNKCKEFVTKIAPIVSSAKSASVILRLWDRNYKSTADMVVIEGPLAGGHLGFSNNDLHRLGADTKIVSKTYLKEIFDKEIEDIIKVVSEYENKYEKKIPVIVAGGIYNKNDVSHAFKLGATGVQVGTRFVTTHECDAPLAYKEAYINAKEEEIRITVSPAGLPGRAIENEFLRRLDKGNIPVRKCYDCLSKCNRVDIPYCITDALISAARGDVDNALLFCGANAWMAKKLESVKEVMEELMSGVPGACVAI